MSTFRSKSWVALYTLGLAGLGVFCALQLGAMVGDGRRPSLNPLLGLMEVLFGRVKPTLLTWILLILVAVGCLVFYVWVGEEPSDKDPAQKNKLLKAHTLEATATKANLSQKAAVSGLSCGNLYGTKKPVIQNWESVGIYWLGPRMGKTSGFIVRHALEAPGSYVFTSNKTDGVAEIIAGRQNMGTVHIFDPEGLLKVSREGRPLMCWDFIGSITSRSRAEAYAKILNDSSKLSGNGENVSSDAFFEPLAEKVVIAALMAAHARGLSVIEMLEMLSQTDLLGLQSILDEDYPLLGNDVRKVADQPEKTKENILAGVSRIFSALSNDEVISWIDPMGSSKEAVFDPYQFVNSHDTLVILVKDGGSSAATLASLLAESVINAGLDIANPRLDPPLVCDFDEVNNTVHIRSLPNRYTYLGSRGVIVNCYLQTYSSGHRLWGENGFKTIRSAATVKVVGGGIEEKELDELSKMLGTYEKKTTSVSTSHQGSYGPSTRSSSSTSRRKEEILSSAELGRLPQFRAVVRVSGVGSGIVEATPWFRDEDLKKRIDPGEVEKVANSLGYSLKHFEHDKKQAGQSAEKKKVKTLV